MSRNDEEKSQAKSSQAKPSRGEVRSDKMRVHVPACGTAQGLRHTFSPHVSAVLPLPTKVLGRYLTHTVLAHLLSGIVQYSTHRQ